MYKHLLIAFFLTQSLNAFAQAPIELLGKTYNSPEVSKLLADLSNKDTGTEIFQPTEKIFKVDYQLGGASLEFNTSMSLYRITMYDSGYTFHSYDNELPLGLKWKMNQAQIEAKVGALEIVDDNEFKKLYSTDDFIIELYFTDGLLSLIKTSATYEKLIAEGTGAIKNWGFRLLPDGKKVDGNVIDGIGTMRWGTNAAIYNGEWAYGLPHGSGEYVDSLGNKYQGEFKLGFFWGNAKFYSKAQNFSYDGNFTMGKRHGQGRLKYGTGQSYKGEFFQDYMHGNGTYVMNKNYMYRGEMSYNTITGRGTLSTNQGSMSGTFKNGKPNGYCEQKSLDESQVLKGSWINGSKEGEFILESNGTTTTKVYENNIEIKSGPIDKD